MHYMKSKKYKNGQLVKEEKDGILTYFFEDGEIKAQGPFENNMMEGEWKFYKKGIGLWQVGNFKNNQKHGRIVRYNEKGEVEYDETFEEGKLVK